MLRALLSTLCFGAFAYAFINAWGAITLFVLERPHWVTDSLGTTAPADHQFNLGLKFSLVMVVPWLLVFGVTALIRRTHLAAMTTPRLVAMSAAGALFTAACAAALSPMAFVPRPVLLAVPPLVGLVLLRAPAEV